MSSLTKRAAVESRTLAPRAAMLAALDIGASKITCFIGSTGQGTGPLRVAGVGTQPARGVRNGAIVDLDEQAHGEITFANAEIGPKERRRVVGSALAQVRLDGRSILHATPSFFVVDGQKVRDPRGMLGRRLGVAVTVVTAPTPQWRKPLHISTTVLPF